MDLKKINIVLIVTILLGVRAVYDMNISQAIVSIGFLSLYGFMKFLETKQQPDVTSEIKAELEIIKSHISGITVKNALKPVEQLPPKRFF